MQVIGRRFWHGCAWGLVATLAMTLFSVIAWRVWPSEVRDPLPLAVTVGIVARVFNAQPLAPAVLVLATIIQFAYGALWCGMFEISTRHATPRKGIVLGLGLWLIMVVFYMPMAGVDVFNVATSKGVWITTLISHMIYGYVAGLLLARDQRHVPLPDEAVFEG